MLIWHQTAVCSLSSRYLADHFPFCCTIHSLNKKKKSPCLLCWIRVQPMAALGQTHGAILLENLDETPSNARKILLELIGFQMSLGSYKLL